MPILKRKNSFKKFKFEKGRTSYIEIDISESVVLFAKFYIFICFLSLNFM